MVDLTRDANGQVRARLLDLVLSRSGPVHAGWLDAHQPEFRAQIKSAALDPFRGYASALRDPLSDGVQVLDSFHVVELGARVVGEVRVACNRNNSSGAAKDDPLYKIRGLLRHRLEHLSERQHTSVRAGLLANRTGGRARLGLLSAAARFYAATASLRERRTLAGKVIQLPDLPTP